MKTQTVVGIVLVPLALFGICCGGFMTLAGIGKRALRSEESQPSPSRRWVTPAAIEAKQDSEPISERALWMSRHPGIDPDECVRLNGKTVYISMVLRDGSIFATLSPFKSDKDYFVLRGETVKDTRPGAVIQMTGTYHVQQATEEVAPGMVRQTSTLIYTRLED